MPHEPSTSVVVCDPVFAEGERLALAASWPATGAPTRDAYALDLRQFVAWCADRRWRCSRPAEPISRPTPGPWRSEVGLGPRWPAACARWPVSTATPKKKGCWPSPRRCTCAGPAWTTSPMPSAWTATRWAPCWSPPDSDRPSSTPSSRCWRSTGCGSPKRPGPTSKRWAWNGDTAP